MPAVESDLLDIIAKEALVDRAALVKDATLEDLGIQSIDVISVLFEIEEKYGIVLEPEDFPKMTTLGEMSDYLLSRINAVQV